MSSGSGRHWDTGRSGLVTRTGALTIDVEITRNGCYGKTGRLCNSTPIWQENANASLLKRAAWRSR
jgi:hypothetical protein